MGNRNTSAKLGSFSAALAAQQEGIAKDQIDVALAFLRKPVTKSIHRGAKEAYLMRKGVSPTNLNKAFEIIEKEELNDLRKSEAAKLLLTDDETVIKNTLSSGISIPNGFVFDGFASGQSASAAASLAGVAANLASLWRKRAPIPKL